VLRTVFPTDLTTVSPMIVALIFRMTRELSKGSSMSRFLDPHILFLADLSEKNCAIVRSRLQKKRTDLWSESQRITSRNRNNQDHHQQRCS
jgi:hypothetical protein